MRWARLAALAVQPGNRRQLKLPAYVTGGEAPQQRRHRASELDATLHEPALPEAPLRKSQWAGQFGCCPDADPHPFEFPQGRL